ncbi:MAG: glycosyltransferase family 2 protein [Flavobacteriales bacterium]
MKVSVALTVYNKARFLNEVLESIFAQTFRDYEIVAVDDKSTDESLQVLRSIQDPRLRIIELPQNLGHPGATQTAFEQSRGEYIIRCDADDRSFQDRFAKQVAFMDAHPEVGMSGGALQLFGDSEGVWDFPLENDDCQAQALFSNPVPDCASIIRRSVLVEHDVGFRTDWPRVSADWLFMIDMAGVTRLGNISDPILHYRRGEQNISALSSSMDARREVIKMGLRRFGLEGTPEQVEAHLTTNGTIKARTAEEVQLVHAWLKTMERVNATLGRSSADAFKRMKAVIWRRLFFTVERADRKSLWAYIKLSGGLPRDLAQYLLKVRTSSLLGRQ